MRQRCGSVVPIPRDLDAKAEQVREGQKAAGSVRCSCGEYIPFIVRRACT